MSLLPQNYLDAVVAIETPGTEKVIATGFLAGFKSGEKDSVGGDLYRVFLITNRHVFRNKKEVTLKFNKGGLSKRYSLALIADNLEIWSTHPNPKVDVAVVPIDINKLKEDGVEFYFIQEEDIAFTDTMKKLGISQGDGIFVLGFPMGLAGDIRKYVITRGGVIARLDAEIIDKEKSFLIDSSIFPGNSGGPVIIKPTNEFLTGTSSPQKAYLIGVVRAYIPYTETAYSLQTETPQPRVDFIENSGLALVVPLDYVRDIVLILFPKKDNENQQKLLN